MPAPLLPRSLRVLTTSALATAALLAGGCGKVTADQGAIEQDLGKAYGAYEAYVAKPAQAGKLGPDTSTTDPVLSRATDAARYATLAVEAARQEAAPDTNFATFAQKTAAAGASLNAVSEALKTGHITNALAAGGLASLESLRAAGRDRGLKITTIPVKPSDLGNPPATAL